MTSAERIDDPAESSVPEPVTYAGPEWMGKANWHSVAESYLLRAVKPLLFLLTKLMLAINTRFPQVLLGRAYDGSERVTNWMPAVRGSRTEKIELPNCPAEWVWNETTPPVEVTIRSFQVCIARVWPPRRQYHTKYPPSTRNTYPHSTPPGGV